MTVEINYLRNVCANCEASSPSNAHFLLTKYSLVPGLLSNFSHCLKPQGILFRYRNVDPYDMFFDDTCQCTSSGGINRVAVLSIRPRVVAHTQSVYFLNAAVVTHKMRRVLHIQAKPTLSFYSTRRRFMSPNLKEPSRLRSSSFT